MTGQARPLRVVCAWCKREKVGEAWVAAPPPRIPVTHGICPRCRDNMAAKIKARKDGGAKC